MKRILLATLASCLLAFAAAADIGPPGTVESTVSGVSVDAALACHATGLGDDAKKLFRDWTDLNAKAAAGTLTDEEYMMGSMIAQSGACFQIAGGLPGTVVLLDGQIYLVDYCDPEWGCIRVIQNSDGVLETEGATREQRPDPRDRIK